jgi:hypothetical protein
MVFSWSAAAIIVGVVLGNAVARSDKASRIYKRLFPRDDQLPGQDLPLPPVAPERDAARSEGPPDA